MTEGHTNRPTWPWFWTGQLSRSMWFILFFSTDRLTDRPTDRYRPIDRPTDQPSVSTVPTNRKTEQRSYKSDRLTLTVHRSNDRKLPYIGFVFFDRSLTDQKVTESTDRPILSVPSDIPTDRPINGPVDQPTVPYLWPCRFESQPSLGHTVQLF